MIEAQAVPQAGLRLARRFLLILSGGLRALGLLYWMCLTRRWPRRNEVRFFFAGYNPANLTRRAEMLNPTNGTTTAPVVQKAPRSIVTGRLDAVTAAVLTVNGQAYARGQVFKGEWPTPQDVGRACELTLVQAKAGLFVVAVILAAAIAAETAAETPAEAPKAPKPISPKQLEILVERVKERKLEGAVAEIAKLRFGKTPEALTSQEASFMIDFFGRHPASWQRKPVQPKQ